jgi:hypothetical protein
MTLSGLQLSLVSTVPTYRLENPPSKKQVAEPVAIPWSDRISQFQVSEKRCPPELPFKVGDRVIAAKFKQAVPGKVITIFGNQIEVKFDQTDIHRPVVTGVYLADQFQRFPPEQNDLDAAPRYRRHSPKGKACGWIEKREGNKQRKKPSLNYYYCWETPTSRQKLYIPVRKRWRIQQMVEEERRTIAEILEFLNS